VGSSVSGHSLLSQMAMIAADESVAAVQYPEYSEACAPCAPAPYPHLLGRAGAPPMENLWQPPTCQPACQPIISVPTVLSTQPSNSYMDPYMVPFPQVPPVMAPNPAYPYALPPPPPPPPQAGYTVVHVVPVEPPNSSTMPPPPTKHQLLLDPFLQPPSEGEAWAPNSDEPSRKPDEMSSSGHHRPEQSSHRAGSSRKVLAPGLVGVESGSTSSQDASAENTPQPEEAPVPERSMDAQKVASLFRDDKTTVMLRNIPNRYTCEELLSEVIMAGFDRMFDFFYLPMDFKTKRNRGYGFINFHSTSAAKQFALAFHHRQLKLYASKKIMEVAPAVTQGYQANLSKYFEKDSDRIKNDWFRPMLFTHEAFELD